MLYQRCMECGEKATHKFTKKVNGEWREFYYCDEHAQQHSHAKSDMNNMINVMLKMLNKKIDVSEEPEEGLTEKGRELRMCTNCGLDYNKYRRTLILGCSACYDSFRDLLIPELQKYHGSTIHTGRKPGKPSDDTHYKLQALVELRKRMKQSLTREDYAEAARLRDQIKLLESEN